MIRTLPVEKDLFAFLRRVKNLGDVALDDLTTEVRR